MASRDRLGAYRAQQQGGGDGRYNDQPAYGGGGGGGYSARRENPYAQQDRGQYEMSAVSPPAAPPTNGDDLSAFYAEIADIQDGIRALNEHVAAIGELQGRSLNATDDAAGARDARELERRVGDARELSAQLKRRITALFERPARGRDAQVRSQQAAFVKSKFVEAIQNYQQVEQQHRTRYKQRIERQYKIVKPDATPEEVRAVVNDEGGGQIFSQALMNSNRYGEGRAAYREVQERHADIKKIERTLTELHQLFQDMSLLVEKQGEAIDVIQQNAVNVDTDVHAGFQDTEKAVDSARGARRKRWICFWICVLIAIIVAVVVVVSLHPWTKK